MSILLTINFLVVIILSLVIGLSHSQKEAVIAVSIGDHERVLKLNAQQFLKVPSSEHFEPDISRAVRLVTTEKSRLSIERSKALLRQQGIDLDDPQWRTQLDKLD